MIRQLFSSSPRDPRYHMLSYISHKFSHIPRPSLHEPRSALFLNRFTRTLPIMYATDGLADILGIRAAELRGKSFFFCIQENCLRDAVKCLESAKANDSIAYMRFWYRDPRQDDTSNQDEHTVDGVSSGDEDDGGVHLNDRMDEDGSDRIVASNSSGSRSGNSNKRWSGQSMQGKSSGIHADGLTPPSTSMDPNSRTSSGNSTDLDGNAPETIFDRPNMACSSASSLSNMVDEEEVSRRPRNREATTSHIELEAVVSCTSDGLVVVLRQARPAIPRICSAATQLTSQRYDNGLFASPWAVDPILPYLSSHTHAEPSNPYPLDVALAGPMNAINGMSNIQNPPVADFMGTIREVAVFAWALTGINGSLAAYSRGKPLGEAQPPSLPIWDPRSVAGPEHNHYYNNAQRQVTGSRRDYQSSLYGSRGPRPQEHTSWLGRISQGQAWDGLLPQNHEAYGNGDRLPGPESGYHAQNGLA